VPAKFVLKKDRAGKFRFNLLATNGQVIAASEAYNTKAAALNGINSVRKNAAGATLDDQSVTAAKAAAPAKKAPAKKAPARKAPARKAPAKRAAAAKAPARTAVVKKAAARKAPARKAPTRKAPAKKS